MLVALPSSIAFGVLVFTAMGPANAAAGAMAGALGAAALGLVAPLIGRNGGFITAPCAPAAAVMSGFAASLAAGGAMAMERMVGLMVLAALLSAGLQVGYGLLRLGRFMKYIPYQVVSGYLSGVAVIIAAGQLPKLLGVAGGVGFMDSLTHPGWWQWPGIVVGVVTIVVTVVAPRYTQIVPAAILGLAAGIATYFGITVLRPELLSVSGNPLVIGPLDATGSLSEVVQRGTASLATFSFGDVRLVLATAATLSVLLSIDTLKTGVVLDVLTRRRHDSNRELVGQGVANAVAALTGGMPGAGTMGPTLVNVTSGGRSLWSGFAEGMLCVLAFLGLRSVLAWVPIGALAGILLVVAFKMFDWKIFRLLLRPATRLDFLVIGAVIVVAESVGLIQATVVGIVLSILIFIRNQVKKSVILRKRDLTEVASKTSRLEEARAILHRVGEQAMLVELQDDLFFGTTDGMFAELSEHLMRKRFLLLDLRRVQSMDYTAGQLFKQMKTRLEERGGSLLFCGMPSGSPTRQDMKAYLTELGVLEASGTTTVYETRDEALEWMESQLLAAAGWSDDADDPALGLPQIELFREFDDAALMALEGIVEKVHLAAGANLFRQGDEGDKLYLIRRGAIDVHLRLGEKTRHHLATMSRGDYLGEMSFLDQQNRSADASAKCDTDLYALSRERFNGVARENPIVATKVFARLALLVSKRVRTANAELHVLEQR